MRTITAPGRMAVSAALAGVTVVGLITGCSKQTTGTSVASQTTASSAVAGPGHLNEPLWNPCNSVQAAALQAAKLDPGTKVVGIDSGEAVNATTKSCLWTSTEGPYQVGVASVRETLAQRRLSSKLSGFSSVQVGPRAGLTYDDKNDAASDKLTCYVGMPYTQGILEVFLYWRRSERDQITQSPPCDLALSHAVELEPFLPK